jgi:hypothetical protein
MMLKNGAASECSPWVLIIKWMLKNCENIPCKGVEELLGFSEYGFEVDDDLSEDILLGSIVREHIEELLLANLLWDLLDHGGGLVEILGHELIIGEIQQDRCGCNIGSCKDLEW